MQFPHDPERQATAHAVYRDTQVVHQPWISRRTSWGAILAGLAIALAVQIILTLLGVGIGLSTVDVVDDANPVSGLGTGAVIWGVVSLLITLFVGGWVAGRLSGARHDRDGALHGAVVFGLVTIASVYLFTSAVTGVVSTASSVVGKGLSVAGSAAGAGIAAAGPGLDETLRANGVSLNLSSLQSEAELLLRQTGKPALQPDALRQQADTAQNKTENAAQSMATNPQASDTTGQSLIDSLFAQGKAVGENFDREAAVNTVMARTGKTREESSAIVDRWVATYEKAKATYEQKKAEFKVAALKKADQAAAAASKASLLAAIGLLLGGIVSLVAGGLGARRAAVVVVTTHAAHVHPSV